MIVKVSKPPSVIQRNATPISESAREHIYNGKIQPFNDVLKEAFCLNVPKFVNQNNNNSLMWLIVGIVMVSTIIFVIPGIFFIKKYIDMQKECVDSGNKAYIQAIDSVKAGKCKCYKYNLTQIREYEYYSSDSVSVDYYLDLGEFCVYSGKYPDMWNRCNTAYGTVVNVDGKDVFFLFHCE